MVGTMRFMRQDEARPQRHYLHRRPVRRSLMRRVLGWTMIALALLGFVLPLLPGIVFLGLGIVLLGPHDPTLRRVGLGARMVLRRWSQVRQRHLRSIGWFARQRYTTTRLTLREYLNKRSAGTTSPHLERVLLTITLIGVLVAASAIVVLWHTGL